MSDVAVLLGQRCAPNMVAYLDGRLAQGDDFAVISTNPDTIPSWLQQHDRLEVVSVSIADATGIGRALTSTRAVRRALADRDVDVVEQVTQPPWHIPAVIAGASRHDVRVRVRLAGSVLAEGRRASGWRPWIANNLLTRAAVAADEVVTPAHDPCPSLAGIDPREREMPLDESRFSPAAPPASSVWTQPNRRVLTVGRVSEPKGIDTLLAVAEELPDHEFAIAGGVRDAGLATRALNAENVRLLGHQDYREMPGLYTAADVFVSFSRHEWNGISRAMLEARACETPVIARDIDAAGRVADRTVIGPDSYRSAIEAATADEPARVGVVA